MKKNNEKDVTKALEQEISAFVKEHGLEFKYDAIKLPTFHLCADNGLELEGSTIDAIAVDNDNKVYFIYNDNSDYDNDYLGHFKVENVRKFFEGIKKAFWLEKIISEVESQRHIYFESEFCPFATIGDKPNTDYDEIAYGDNGLEVHEEKGDWITIYFDTKISNKDLKEIYDAVIFALDY